MCERARTILETEKTRLQRGTREEEADFENCWYLAAAALLALADKCPGLKHVNVRCVET